MTDQKEMKVELPDRGVVFWPIGSGDSTTICVGNDVVMQVDIRHLTAADDSDDPRMALIDHLVKILPKKDGKPYLSVFALTHPDEDHCRGFADLLNRVTIGEIWHTPRVFRVVSEEQICDDAKTFRREAKRRVKKTIESGGSVGPGDRVRIIGRDEILDEADYSGFPKERLTVPGNTVTNLDGEECSDRFRAFVHAPFKDDCVAGDRNDTSLGLQVVLTDGTASGRLLLFGDLCFPTVNRIFEISKLVDVNWDVFLAPHHCSKSVMYWKDEGETDETLKQELLNKIEAAASESGYVIASSEVIPAENEPGDNPPHAIAKARYQEIAPAGFLCTQEHPNTETPEPIIFDFSVSGLKYRPPTQKSSAASVGVATAVSRARGGNEPPADRVGFGRTND